MGDLRDNLPVPQAEIAEVDGYNRHWWESACRAARVTLRIESTSRILIGTGITGLFLVALWWGGYNDLAKGEILLRGISTLVLLGLFPVVVLFHAVRYPAQRHRQAANRIGELNSRIASHTAQQAAIDHLAGLHNHGHQTGFRSITIAEYDHWLAQMNQWSKDVFVALGSFSAAEQNSFLNASQMTHDYVIKVSEAHNDSLNNIHARLDRLQAIIDSRLAALIK